jgi:hypothetical protein
MRSNAKGVDFTDPGVFFLTTQPKAFANRELG